MKKLNNIENNIKLIKDKLLDNSLSIDILEKHFLSIKTQLKDLKIPFFMYFSKKRQLIILEKKEVINKIKNFIDMKHKKGVKMPLILNELNNNHKILIDRL